MAKLEITVSKPVLDELQSLSDSEADIVLNFLEHLAENPYDQTLIGSANAKGDLFASSVTDKLYLYWSFHTKSQLPGHMMQPKINVLGLAQRQSNHGLVLLTSVTHEKLQSA